MKLIFFLCLSMTYGLMSLAQTVTILDKDSKAPLPGVVLSDAAINEFITTNANGEADITKLKGSELIEIQILAYRPLLLSYRDIVNQEFTINLEKTLLNLKEVVVSATRWRQSSDKLATKIIPISLEEVAFQNPQTAADMLELSGRVFVQKSQQGGGSPMIRGFSANRLIYSVDGVRMNTAIFRSGNLQNVISLDPYAIENTEVLMGPGSVIYGSDAIGGVMSFQTLEPTFSSDEELLVTGKASTRYSSANKEKAGHFDLNLGWNKWAFVASISSWDFDHLRQGANGPDDYLKPYYAQRQDSVDVVISQEDALIQRPSAYAQTNMMYKLKYKPAEAWDIVYAFHNSATSTYGRYDRHNRVRDETARYAEWNYGPQRWTMHQLSVSHESDSGIYDGLSLRLAAQRFEESRIDRSLNDDLRSIRSEAVDAYSLNLDLTKAMSDFLRINYGIEYVLDQVVSTGVDENISNGFIQPGPSRYPQADWSSMGAYLSAEYELSKRGTLQAGLRYNQVHIDAQFDTTFFPLPFVDVETNVASVTGSLGLVSRPTETVVMSINASTAFRAPNVDDMGKIFDSEPGAVVVPNDDLDAEYAYVLDMNVAKTFGDRLKLDASVYFTMLDQALVKRNFQLNGLDSIMYDGELSQVQAVQNAAEAEVYGVQFGLEIKLPQGFSLSSDINYQQGEEELEDGTVSPSRHASPLFGRANLRYRKDKVELQCYVEYQGTRSHEDLAEDEKGKTEIYAKDSAGETYAPSWYTLNFKSSYQISKSIMLLAGLENLTDQRYRPYSSGISGAGRNFILAINARF